MTTQFRDLVRFHSEVTSLFLECEYLHSSLTKLLDMESEIPTAELSGFNSHVLGLIHNVVKQCDDLLQVFDCDCLWHCRQAHAKLYPKTLVAELHPSFHDSIFFLSSGFVVDLQTSDREPSDMPVSISPSWPTKYNKSGIQKALVFHKSIFADVRAAQGYLAIELATALDFTSDNLSSSDRDISDLTPRERLILEAIGDSTMQGPEISKAAGYQNNSAFRSTLSGMVKRKHLEKCPNGDGYRRPTQNRVT